MTDFGLDVREANGIVILETDGYLNNIAGEKIAEVCSEKLEEDKKMFLINLERTKVVNSIRCIDTDRDN